MSTTTTTVSTSSSSSSSPMAPTTIPPRHYYRTLFTVYWQDVAPSTEVFYLVGPTYMTPASISAMEKFILLQLQEHMQDSTLALHAIYITHSAIEMTVGDIIAADWRVIDTMSPPSARATRA